jgi:hypothetical protein
MANKYPEIKLTDIGEGNSANGQLQYFFPSTDSLVFMTTDANQQLIEVHDYDIPQQLIPLYRYYDVNVLSVGNNLYLTNQLYVKKKMAEEQQQQQQGAGAGQQVAGFGVKQQVAGFGVKQQGGVGPGAGFGVQLDNKFEQGGVLAPMDSDAVKLQNLKNTTKRWNVLEGLGKLKDQIVDFNREVRRLDSQKSKQEAISFAKNHLAAAFIVAQDIDEDVRQKYVDQLG